jgi:hypothetical protein
MALPVTVFEKLLGRNERHAGAYVITTITATMAMSSPRRVLDSLTFYEHIKELQRCVNSKWQGFFHVMFAM